MLTNIPAGVKYGKQNAYFFFSISRKISSGMLVVFFIIFSQVTFCLYVCYSISLLNIPILLPHDPRYDLVPIQVRPYVHLIRTTYKCHVLRFAHFYFSSLLPSFISLQYLQEISNLPDLVPPFVRRGVYYSESKCVRTDPSELAFIDQVNYAVCILTITCLIRPLVPLVGNGQILPLSLTSVSLWRQWEC